MQVGGVDAKSPCTAPPYGPALDPLQADTIFADGCSLSALIPIGSGWGADGEADGVRPVVKRAADTKALSAVAVTTGDPSMVLAWGWGTVVNRLCLIKRNGGKKPGFSLQDQG